MIACVCAVTGAWADIPSGATAIGGNGSYYQVDGSTCSIHVESADQDLSGLNLQSVIQNNYIIKVTGTVSGTGVSNISKSFELLSFSFIFVYLEKLIDSEEIINF